jgi:hypothetical protein
MTGWHKLVISVVGGLLIAGAVTVWGFRSLLNEPCANRLMAEFPSPEGTLKAVVFERDCGTTTDVSTQVSIVSANASLSNQPANLFAGDTDHGKAPSGPKGGPEVRVSWVGARSLRVSHHRNAHILLASHNVAGVAVEYDTLE